MIVLPTWAALHDLQAFSTYTCLWFEVDSPSLWPLFRSLLDGLFVFRTSSEVLLPFVLCANSDVSNSFPFMMARSAVSGQRSIVDLSGVLAVGRVIFTGIYRVCERFVCIGGCTISCA